MMNKIDRKKYEKAKEIVSKYEQQERDNERKTAAELREKQRVREGACSGHEYVDASYKWGSPTRVECIYCGKAID